MDGVEVRRRGGGDGSGGAADTQKIHGMQDLIVVIATLRHVLFKVLPVERHCDLAPPNTI